MLGLKSGSHSLTEQLLPLWLCWVQLSIQTRLQWGEKCGCVAQRMHNTGTHKRKHDRQEILYNCCTFCCSVNLVWFWNFVCKHDWPLEGDLWQKINHQTPLHITLCYNLGWNGPFSNFYASAKREAYRTRCVCLSVCLSSENFKKKFEWKTTSDKDNGKVV